MKKHCALSGVLWLAGMAILCLAARSWAVMPVPTSEYLLEVKVSQDASWTFVEGVASDSEAKRRLRDLEQSGYYFAVRIQPVWAVPGTEYFLHVKRHGHHFPWTFLESVNTLAEAKVRLRDLEQSREYFRWRSDPSPPGGGRASGWK